MWEFENFGILEFWNFGIFGILEFENFWNWEFGNLSRSVAETGFAKMF